MILIVLDCVKLLQQSKLQVPAFGHSQNVKLEYKSCVQDRNPTRERRGDAKAKMPCSNITLSLVTLQRLKESSLHYIVGNAEARHDILQHIRYGDWHSYPWIDTPTETTLCPIKQKHYVWKVLIKALRIRNGSFYEQHRRFLRFSLPTSSIIISKRVLQKLQCVPTKVSCFKQKHDNVFLTRIEIYFACSNNTSTTVRATAVIARTERKIMKIDL